MKNKSQIVKKKSLRRWFGNLMNVWNEQNLFPEILSTKRLASDPHQVKSFKNTLKRKKTTTTKNIKITRAKLTFKINLTVPKCHWWSHVGIFKVSSPLGFSKNGRKRFYFLGVSESQFGFRAVQEQSRRPLASKRGEKPKGGNGQVILS